MTHRTGKYRLVTRSDFDGLVCAILLREMNLIDDILFVHPKDVQDGKVGVTDRDILTNLPYVPTCHLCFDHHASERLRNGVTCATNHVLDPDADSAARVVYNYFGGAARFPGVSQEMMAAVDRADSARYTRSDILAPTGWTLLSFIMDPRTGLGRFRNYRISNYQLMMELIDYCRHYTVQQVLELPDVGERVVVYNAQREKYCEQIARCTTEHGPVIAIDLRDEETIYCGNRFLPYALFPDCNISVTVIWGRDRQNTVLAIGKSILNRTNPVDVGALALTYGGGGHTAAGTCQVPNSEADRILEEILNALNRSIDDEYAGQVSDGIPVMAG